MARTINALLNYPDPVYPQDLSQFWQGEDVAFTFAVTSTVDVSTWGSVEFTLLPEGRGPSGRYTVSVASGQVVVSDTSGTAGAYTAVVTVTVPSATTKTFGQGSATWQCTWADSGDVALLGGGEVGINAPTVPIP